MVFLQHLFSRVEMVSVVVPLSIFKLLQLGKFDLVDIFLSAAQVFENIWLKKKMPSSLGGTRVALRTA